MSSIEITLSTWKEEKTMIAFRPRNAGKYTFSYSIGKYCYVSVMSYEAIIAYVTDLLNLVDIDTQDKYNHIHIDIPAFPDFKIEIENLDDKSKIHILSRISNYLLNLPTSFTR